MEKLIISDKYIVNLEKVEMIEANEDENMMIIHFPQEKIKISLGKGRDVSSLMRDLIESLELQDDDYSVTMEINEI